MELVGEVGVLPDAPAQILSYKEMAAPVTQPQWPTLPDGTRRLRFTGPRRADYRQGLQVAYIAFGPPEQLVPHVTPYRLLSARWR